MYLKLRYASKSVTNGRMNGWMDEQMNAPEAICPSNFFEVGGKIASMFFQRAITQESLGEDFT